MTGFALFVFGEPAHSFYNDAIPGTKREAWGHPDFDRSGSLPPLKPKEGLNGAPNAQSSSNGHTMESESSFNCFR